MNEKTLQYKIYLLNLRLKNSIREIKEQPIRIKTYELKINKNDDILNKCHSVVEFSNYEIAGIKISKDILKVNINYYKE